MAQLRDFLDRFRPAGAPGAASRAAVPADRSRELEAELLPVLALLGDTHTECAGIVAQARDEAGQIVAAARAEAADSLAEAVRHAGAVRAQTVRQAVAVAEAETASMVAGARHEAGAVGELARQRIPVLADRAVGLVRALGEPGWPS